VEGAWVAGRDRKPLANLYQLPAEAANLEAEAQRGIGGAGGETLRLRHPPPRQRTEWVLRLPERALPGHTSIMLRPPGNFTRGWP
jgi:hypothetical protein